MWPSVHGNNKDSTVKERPLNPKTGIETEQNICHFETHAKEIPATALTYIGKGYVFLRTLCGFILVGDIIVDTSNHSNICIPNFRGIIGYDFNYTAPVTSRQLLQSNYMLVKDLLPTSTGINLNAGKEIITTR